MNQEDKIEEIEIMINQWLNDKVWNSSLLREKLSSFATQIKETTRQEAWKVFKEQGEEAIRLEERERIIKSIDKLLSPSNHPMLLMVKDIINKEIKQLDK